MVRMLHGWRIYLGMSKVSLRLERILVIAWSLVRHR